MKTDKRENSKHGEKKNDKWKGERNEGRSF